MIERYDSTHLCLVSYYKDSLSQRGATRDSDSEVSGIDYANTRRATSDT